VEQAVEAATADHNTSVRRHDIEVADPRPYSRAPSRLIARASVQIKQISEALFAFRGPAGVAAQGSYSNCAQLSGGNLVAPFIED